MINWLIDYLSDDYICEGIICDRECIGCEYLPELLKKQAD